MIKALLAVLVAMFVSTGIAKATDIQSGEQVFTKCRSCHTIGEGAKNKVRPQLNGLFGRVTGNGEGYSNANKNSRIVWSAENFAEYISDPRGFMPATNMSFGGLKKDIDVINLTADLGQFQADGSIRAVELPGDIA